MYVPSVIYRPGPRNITLAAVRIKFAIFAQFLCKNAFNRVISVEIVTAALGDFAYCQKRCILDSPGTVVVIQDFSLCLKYFNNHESRPRMSILLEEISDHVSNLL